MSRIVGEYVDLLEARWKLYVRVWQRGFFLTATYKVVVLLFNSPLTFKCQPPPSLSGSCS